ncbi:hypothetical protein GGI07_002676 [Coemansia sp. Benny D115]|nr:hypothetical protein GGI07_002676 [Coemansia sp. Benny D115]
MGGARKVTSGRRGTGKVQPIKSKRSNNTSRKPRGSKSSSTSRKDDDDSVDVFNAEDPTTDILRRRNLERVDVRDYEVENIDSEDDEDIDSDDAFDEADAERFGGYKFGGSSGAQKHRGDDDDDDEDLDEEEYLDDMDDDEDLVDLSEMLDAESDEETPAKKKKAAARKDQSAPNSATLLSFKDLALKGVQSSSEDEDDEEDEDEDDVLARMDSDEEDDDDQDGEDSDADADSKLSKLGGFVSSISARAPKRRFVSEIDTGLAEDENAIGTGLQTKGVSLGINDLLGDFGIAAAADGDDDGEDNEKATGAAETQKNREIRKLREQVTKLERSTKKSGAGVVAAPLAKRLQDQVDRKVAYSKTKKSLNEWQPAVDAQRAAEHVVFQDEKARFNLTTAGIVSSAANGQDKSSMESQIASILAESGMSEEQQRQYEELELKEVSAEEIRKRQKELRMMRELMFRSEQKAKRLAKIKSKAYRRILKKDKARAQDKALEKIREDDPEVYAMLMEKRAQDRAEERITLRHKNTSKWSREMASRSHGDADRQQAIRDQLEQHEALKRKIHDVGSDEELSDVENGRQGANNYDDSDSDANDGTFEDLRGRALRNIEAEMDQEDNDAIADDAPHKALFSMKFMQNAAQRRREEAQRDAQMMRDEFESLQADVDEDGNALSISRAKKGGKKDTASSSDMAPGRMSFGGGLKKRGNDAQQQQQQDGEVDGDDADSSTTLSKRVRLNEAGQVSQVASGTGHRVRLAEPMTVSAASKNGEASDAASNPWLSEEAGASSGQRRSGKMNQISKDSSKADKLSAHLRAKRSDMVVEAGGPEESVILDVTKTLPLERPAAADDVDSDPEEQDGIRLQSIRGKKKKTNPNAFAQRDLVEQAFAEDDIVDAEFAAEKAQIMEEDAPKTEDLTLPGWGSWGGTGLKAKKGKVVKKIPGGVEKNKRTDSKLGKVIIDQRTLKSSYKYCSSNVPFPFYTPEQYEETLQVPLGKDWNTTKSHSKMIKPRILTKAGQIIAPMTIPSKKHQ